ncbi:hypothetical protein C8J57DRAFT_1369857 [Mycena rebaudengoi]|nr:hypothetical protein C8J57DRAFT_1369857 [Mycena rebaudengoi]
MALKLNNGLFMPSVGVGCWMGLGVASADCYAMVKEALRIGYRHIDTASNYGNEESVVGIPTVTVQYGIRLRVIRQTRTVPYGPPRCVVRLRVKPFAVPCKAVMDTAVYGLNTAVNSPEMVRFC